MEAIQALVIKIQTNILVQAKNLEMILGMMEHLQNKMDSIQTYQLM